MTTRNAQPPSVPTSMQDLREWCRKITVSVNAVIQNRYFLKPVESDNASAPNGTIYYSTDANKLVYKDNSGVVNNLY